jgi:type II secretory pathway component GspD/PulD (secretin)
MNRLFGLVLLVIASAALAAPATRTIELHHRPADAMAATLRPLAGDSTVIPAGNALILRGEPAVLDELAKVITRLDVAPRQLRLTVRQGGRAALLSEGIHATPGSRVYSTRDRNAPNLVQSVRVMEGGWARINTGRSIPQPNQTVTIGPGGAVVQQSTEYHDVDSGFEVRPQIIGDTVHLAVRAYRGDVSRRHGGVIDTQEVTSTLQGALGEWLVIGGQDSESREAGSGIVYSTRSRAVEARSIQIKVELVP